MLITSVCNHFEFTRCIPPPKLRTRTLVTRNVICLWHFRPIVSLFGKWGPYILAEIAEAILTRLKCSNTQEEKIGPRVHYPTTRSKVLSNSNNSVVHTEELFTLFKVIKFSLLAGQFLFHNQRYWHQPNVGHRTKFSKKRMRNSFIGGILEIELIVNFMNSWFLSVYPLLHNSSVRCRSI